MALIQKENVKIELGMSTDEQDYDTLLQLMAQAVQSVFEDLTNRKFESAVFTEYYSTRKGAVKIFLKNYPILAITSLYDDPDWLYTSADLISAADYTYDADNGIVFYDGAFFEGFNNIKIVYSAGYTPTTLPKGIKEVWMRQIALWFKDSKDQDWGKGHIITSQGSVIKKTFKDNLLPDFRLLAGLHERIR